MIFAGQNDGVAVELSVNLKRLAAIRHPTLVPGIARSIIDAEALALVSVELLIVLAQNTAVDDRVDASVCTSFRESVSKTSQLPTQKSNSWYAAEEHGVEVCAGNS